MAVNDIYQLMWYQSLGGKEICNSFYYVESEASNETPLVIGDRIIDVFYALVWSGPWRGAISNDVELRWAVCENLTNTPVYTATARYKNERGARNDQSVPNGSTVLFSGFSENGARNFNRRLYFSGLPEGDANNGRVERFAWSAWRDFAKSIPDAVVVAGGGNPGKWEPVSYSPKLAASGQTAHSLLVECFFNDAIKSQRARNLRYSTSVFS